MALSELFSRVPAPADPVGVPFDWPGVEGRLGSSLPGDYKDYCEAYGHGGFFAGFSLDPLTPGHPDPMLDLLGTFFADLLGDDQETGEASTPRPQDLLAVMSTEHQEVIWWRASGSAQTWPLVLERDSGDFEEIDAMSFVDLLIETFSGRGPLSTMAREQDVQFFPASRDPLD
jgi:hypothetical protein